jgi:hypothetical protein
MQTKPEGTQALSSLQNSAQRHAPPPSSMGKDLKSVRENGKGGVGWCWGMVLCTVYSDADYRVLDTVWTLSLSLLLKHLLSQSCVKTVPHHTRMVNKELISQ